MTGCHLPAGVRGGGGSRASHSPGGQVEGTRGVNFPQEPSACSSWRLSPTRGRTACAALEVTLFSGLCTVLNLQHEHVRGDPGLQGPRLPHHWPELGALSRTRVGAGNLPLSWAATCLAFLARHSRPAWPWTGMVPAVPSGGDAQQNLAWRVLWDVNAVIPGKL